jgi:DNA-binding GntR family transcriptional regulator
MSTRSKKLSANPAPARSKPISAPDSFETLSLQIKQTVSIPDKVADFLREMILSGQWRPGDRIVETKVARQLNIGQPAVREALGKLEEAGLVKRFQNAGCVVTQLSKVELSQIFRVRIELESLAVELATASKTPEKSTLLKSSLANLQKTAHKGKVQDFYKADFEFHRTIWQLADNRFLEKALTQLVIPLFNSATIEVLAHDNLDFVKDAAEHAQIVEAILSGDKVHACKILRAALGAFWSRGLELVQHGKPS